MYLYVHYNVHGWGWGGEWEGCIMLHYCPRAVKSTPPIVPLLFRWYKPRILLTMLWTERLPMQKLPFQCSPVRYEGSQSDNQGGMKGASQTTREVWREPVRLSPACLNWRHSSYKQKISYIIEINFDDIYCKSTYMAQSAGGACLTLTLTLSRSGKPNVCLWCESSNVSEVYL